MKRSPKTCFQTRVQQSLVPRPVTVHVHGSLCYPAWCTVEGPVIPVPYPRDVIVAASVTPTVQLSVFSISHIHSASYHSCAEQFALPLCFYRELTCLEEMCLIWFLLEVSTGNLHACHDPLL